MSVTINLQCGVDYSIQFIATDTATGQPVNVTAPKMDVRAGSNSLTAALYTSQGANPTITLTQPQGNVVLAKIAASATKNLPAPTQGEWDCYATDPNGLVVQLGTGLFTATPNITSL